MPQRRRRRQKAIHGILPEAAPQQARNVGLRQPEQLCRLGLLEAALAHDPVDAGDEFRFQQVRRGVRAPQVHEHSFRCLV